MTVRKPGCSDLCCSCLPKPDCEGFEDYPDKGDDQLF